MKTLALILMLACAAPLRADQSLSESLVLRARIVQLEAQLQKLATETAMCSARLALTAQPQQEQAVKATMQTIEKEAGCALDWSVTPVVCKSSK